MRLRRFFFCSALLVSAVASSLSAQEQPAGSTQEIPKEAAVIIARTKMTPTDAYRATMQRLVARGYFMAFSDPVALIASTQPYPGNLGWDLELRMSLLVSTDSRGTYVELRGWTKMFGTVDFRGQSRSPAMRAWGELEGLAKEVGDLGLEYRK